MILRLPPDVAARLHAVLRKQDDGSDRALRSHLHQRREDVPQCTVQFMDVRHGKLTLKLPALDGEEKTDNEHDPKLNSEESEEIRTSPEPAKDDSSAAADAATTTTTTTEVTTTTEAAEGAAAASVEPEKKKGRFVEDELSFVMADLPCLLECYRANTKPGSNAASSDGHIVKSADIGQILLARKADDPSAPACDERYRHPSGLTPLTNNILREFDARQREKRFSRNQIQELETLIQSQAGSSSQQQQQTYAPPPVGQSPAPVQPAPSNPLSDQQQNL